MEICHHFLNNDVSRRRIVGETKKLAKKPEGTTVKPTAEHVDKWVICNGQNQYWDGETWNESKAHAITFDSQEEVDQHIDQCFDDEGHPR